MRDIQLKCYRCGKDNDVIDMRYTAANRMICKNCMEKSKTPQTTETQKSQINGFEKEDPKIEYECKDCHYSFKRKKSAIISVCPYCSKEGVLEIKSKNSVDKLIKESMGENYDM